MSTFDWQFGWVQKSNVEIIVLYGNYLEGIASLSLPAFSVAVKKNSILNPNPVYTSFLFSLWKLLGSSLYL